MFEPLLQAPIHVQIHAIAATFALFLGPFVLFRTRRDTLHKILGYIWMLAMVGAVGSSFFIFDIRLFGAFSPIHLLSILASWGLYSGLRAAVQGDIVRHRETMQSLYFWALGIAGLFTLLPGRIMGQVLFGEHQVKGFSATLILTVSVVIILKIRARSQLGQGGKQSV